MKITHRGKGQDRESGKANTKDKLTKREKKETQIQTKKKGKKGRWNKDKEMQIEENKRVGREIKIAKQAIQNTHAHTH